VIRDETRRVRQPAAWLLLGGVAVSVFLGLTAMLSNGWAAVANAGTLIALAGGGTAGPTFADRAVVASHALTSISVTAMAVAAVALATHFGDKVRHARKITLLAVVLQGIALLFGVLTWLMALGIHAGGSAKLGFFFDGAIGIMVATAGLFFSIVTLRSSELQAARQQTVAERQPAVSAGHSAVDPSSAGYSGHAYGQKDAAQGYAHADYQPGSGYQGPGQQLPPQSRAQAATHQAAVAQATVHQAPVQQAAVQQEADQAAAHQAAADHAAADHAAADRAAAQAAPYHTAAGQQYGARPGHPYDQQSQHPYDQQSQHPYDQQSQESGWYGQLSGGYGQQAYGSYRQQSGGNGQQTYGPNKPAYGSYGRQVSGRQATGQQGHQTGSQSSYGHDYDTDYGQQQLPGQRYDPYDQQALHGQQGYGQPAQQDAYAYQPPDADAFETRRGTDGYQPADTDVHRPNTDAYQQYYRQHSPQPTEQGPPDNGRPNHGLENGDSRHSR